LKAHAKSRITNHKILEDVSAVLCWARSTSTPKRQMLQFRDNAAII